ncbi:putative Polygalacturonase non-catalytic subunit AroGP3 precursor [Hibiscus syriacus]|uniref:Polygalacturonase non-catalytic subunit AroGP3 n=2 Tax=Hibiscus syriacus TaxID=106335 RepID=A0A6A3CW22_HIBSY|nr:putative Polygalacturonase non-catalytic subunit AroGP3 precursor [Hibiscus syriacus]
MFSLVFISTVAVATASVQFKVGGDKGWTKPIGNNSEPYNEWASRNRFHVGDSLYFKYNIDSVLVVNRTSYTDCSVANPTFKFKDGETVFEFDRYGLFYFISGESGHCKAGQKLIVRVMVHPAAAISSPQPAQSPMEDDGSNDNGDGWASIWGPPPHNSTIKQTVASYFMTALGGMLVIMYLLM